MKKLWMIAGSALVMSACSDNVAEMNPAPAGNNDFVTLGRDLGKPACDARVSRRR